MKKLVCLLLILNCFTLSVFAETKDGLFNFKKIYSYTTGQFSDVGCGEWFEENVASAFEYGLMNGDSQSTFNPDGNITIAETIVLASRLHSVYNNGKAEFSNGNPWYKEYIDYAVENDIISVDQYSNYNLQASRAEFVVILTSSLPNSVFEPINNISVGMLPDVLAAEDYATDVYKLYNAGILTGNDEYGTFAPYSNIQRSAVSAIITRIVDTNLRKQFEIKDHNNSNQAVNETEVLTTEQVSQKCSPAVFYVESYGFNGEKKGTGSGFFISSDGLAVTNFHVVANSIYNRIVTSDGKSYEDVSIIDCDEENDVALLRIGGSDFSFLEMADSSSVVQGQPVFAIGSPLGLSNTMSQGIISNISRNLGGVQYIQISVPINHGSSGGALIDVNGKVVGITSAGFDTTGDLNLAVPINIVKGLDFESTEHYFVWEEEFYQGFSKIIDFGAFSGVQLLNERQISAFEYVFEYDIRDFHEVGNFDGGECYAWTLNLYEEALAQLDFECIEVDENVSLFKSDNESIIFSKDLEDTNKIIIYASILPEFYNNFVELPDFGWYSGLPMDAEPYYGDSFVMYTYRWVDYCDKENFENIMSDYFYLIEDYGWEYKGYEPYSTDYPYDRFFFKNNNLNVVFMLDEREFIVDAF